VDPGVEAEATVASLIGEIIGETPTLEPEDARLPSGGVADFRLSGVAFGDSGRHVLVEVKSLHDLTANTRPWMIEYALHHPDAPKQWTARSWSPDGERRIRRLGFSPADLTSPAALIELTSVERLRSLVDRGGRVYQLSAEANQIAAMILFGSNATLNPSMRWPAAASSDPFHGVISEPLDAVAVAFYSGANARHSVAADIRTGLTRKFAGYDGPDACVAVVVSDVNREDSWAALLDGAMGYPLDGSPPVLQGKASFSVPGLLLALYALEPAGGTRWSFLDGAMVETVETLEDVFRAALERSAPAEG
jgi:hypothetical protein